MKKLSIIVPVYNVEKYLRTCLESLVQQTYANKEIILIDDGSTDSSGEICDEYAQKYEYVRCIHQKNAGVMAARNNGLDAADGDYIALIDSDDYIDVDAYEVLIEALERNKADISACGYRMEKKPDLDYSQKEHSDYNEIVLNSKDEVIASLLSENERKSVAGYIWNKVYTRKAVKDVRFRKDFALTDDLMFTWEVIRDNVSKGCFIEIPFYHYRFVASSLTNCASAERYVTALKPFKIMMRDLKGKPVLRLCWKHLCWDYLIWNLRVLEGMAASDKYNERIYLATVRNIRRHRVHIRRLPVRKAIMAHIAIRSWKLYYLIEKKILFIKAAIRK